MKINQRLFDRYGIDTTKDLGIEKTCRKPYDTLLIDKQGSCYACECTAWLPQSIGNIQLRSIEQVLSSDTRLRLQESVKDGTYRYCNEHQCPWLRERIFDEPEGQYIRFLRLAIDQSCNLRCPSCRNDLIFHKSGSAYNLGMRLAGKINNWLRDCSHDIEVHIGSDGDPFASHVYRHFMENTPKRQNIRYSVLTNGLMFKDFHHKVPHVIENLNDLGVSIDGASEETYEKLRLGGKWDKITENLEFISQLKRKHQFKFTLQFVVQKDNYHEMQKIVELGQKYDTDKVCLNRITDWDTFSNFKQQDVASPDHPEYQKFMKELKKVMTDDLFVETATLEPISIS